VVLIEDEREHPGKTKLMIRGSTNWELLYPGDLDSVEAKAQENQRRGEATDRRDDRPAEADPKGGPVLHLSRLGRRAATGP